jgi:hypothetical protein
MTAANSPEGATDHRPAAIDDLVSTVRASVRLRDGYYLSEELVDLYLVGVLRGVAVGLLDADGRDRDDQRARAVRLEELTRTSAELLAQLRRLRPEPASVGPGPARAAPGRRLSPARSVQRRSVSRSGGRCRAPAVGAAQRRSVPRSGGQCHAPAVNATHRRSMPRTGGQCRAPPW